MTCKGLAGRVRLAGDVVAEEGVPALAVPADQAAGGRVRDPRTVRAGTTSRLYLIFRIMAGVSPGLHEKNWPMRPKRLHGSPSSSEALPVALV